MIRFAEQEDRDAILLVHHHAFPTDEEARLVDKLFQAEMPLLSLVAEENDDIVGHILFSPVHADCEPDILLAGLAPVAVLPEFQHRGIGTALIRTGLTACKNDKFRAVFVVGDPGFYRKFGFVGAYRFGLHCTWNVPKEVFMVLELRAGTLKELDATITYHPLFSEL